MEKTKIYIVVMNSFYHVGRDPVGLFLSKEDAEFYVWQRNRIDSSRYCWYSVIEISALNVEKNDKDYKKFKKEKLEELEKELEKKRNCADSDYKEIDRIKEEIEIIKKLN